MNSYASWRLISRTTATLPDLAGSPACCEIAAPEVHGLQAIQISEHGGPDVLRLVELPDAEPGNGEVLVDVAAAGVNFIDVYHRTGLYEVDLPRVLGVEGAGTVRATGQGVSGISTGDVVAWAQVAGSYASRVVVPASAAVVVPHEVPAETAAAMMLQGLTAHYLVNDTHRLAAGEACLVHAAAGGVGLLLVQMAKAKGAVVFGTAGNEEKARLARSAGADHVIRYDETPFREAIEAIAGPRPLAVVYDGIGQPTFHDGLALLRRRGTMVTFGNAGGPVEPISPLVLSRNGSVFLTRPTLGDYIATRQELESRAEAVLGMCATGALEVTISARYPLSEAGRAQEDLAARRTTGKVLLIP
jgi:NADPH2:quinone reductase